MLKKITPAQITLLLYVALFLLEAFAAYAEEIKENKGFTKAETNKESQKIKDLEERIEILEKHITTPKDTDMKSKPEGFNSIMHREAICNQMKKR